MAAGRKPTSDIPDQLEGARHPDSGDEAHDGRGVCRVKGPVEVTLNARPLDDSEHAELNSLIRYQLEASSFPEYKEFMDRLFGPSGASPGKTGSGASSPPAPKISAEGQRSHLGPSCLDPPGRRERILHALGSEKLRKIHGTDAYELLRLATECWLLTRCGPACSDFYLPDPADESPTERGEEYRQFLREDALRWGLPPDQASALAQHRRLERYLKTYVTANGATTPYLNLIVDQLLAGGPANTALDRVFRSRWECPSMIELIRSYWDEEGMLCQTMNAVALRFQNRKSRPGLDPLANFATDPLRPLANLLWGWLESAYKRLTVERRAYEYDHHYGLTLVGKAVPQLLSVDSRSKFLEAFHSLLHLTHLYYVERADTTRIPDGFPLLNALRHVHLILSEGAHNQYGDLPWTSRVEMLIEQWLLARPEMREFLRGRAMVPYTEGWMGQVDTMKKLQGWTDVTVTHFHELATCGEAILLAVRHGPWATTNDQNDAKSWADYWRAEIQRYIYAYKAVTGADLTLDPVSAVMPARLLHARLARQRAAAAH